MPRLTLAFSLVLAAFAAVPALTACNDEPTPDVPAPEGPLPVGNVDGDDDDDDEPAPTGVTPRAPAVTSGGGAASSAAHRVQLSVGAPVPRGDTASTDSRLHMDP